MCTTLNVGPKEHKRAEGIFFFFLFSFIRRRQQQLQVVFPSVRPSVRLSIVWRSEGGVDTKRRRRRGRGEAMRVLSPYFTTTTAYTQLVASCL